MLGPQIYSVIHAVTEIRNRWHWHKGWQHHYLLVSVRTPSFLSFARSLSFLLRKCLSYYLHYFNRKVWENFLQIISEGRINKLF